MYLNRAARARFEKSHKQQNSLNCMNFCSIKVLVLFCVISYESLNNDKNPGK